VVVIQAQEHIVASSVRRHASDLNPGFVTFVGTMVGQFGGWVQARSI
jgi:hypothetical protein